MKKLFFTFVLMFMFCSVGCASLPPEYDTGKPLHGSPFQYTMIEGSFGTIDEDWLYQTMYTIHTYDDSVVQQFFVDNYPNVFGFKYATVVHVLQETMIGFVKVRAVDFDKEFWTLKVFLEKGGW